MNAPRKISLYSQIAAVRAARDYLRGPPPSQIRLIREHLDAVIDELERLQREEAAAREARR